MKPRKVMLFGVICLIFGASSIFFPGIGSANQIAMSDCNFGFHPVLYLSNEQVCVTGDFDCLDDWPLPIPVARVYIVQDDGGSWSTGAALSDAMGSPNTIQGSGLGGAFYDMVIALPSLPVGRFDVIIDENENGTFDSCGGVMDYVLGQGSAYAFEVINTDLDNLVNTDSIKADAGEKSAKWRQQTQELVYSLQGMEVLTTLMTAYSAYTSMRILGSSFGLAVFAGVGAVALVEGVSQHDDAYDLIKELGNTLADKYRDIHLDPPDSTYVEIVALNSIVFSGPANGDLLPSARAPVYNAMSENAAISVAVRSSMEKFFGAEEASNNTYIRIQALALKDYIDLLIESLDLENEALQDLRGAVDSTGFGHVTTYPDSFEVFQARVLAEGFYPEEIDLMTEAGFDSAQILALEEKTISSDVSLATEGSALAHIDSTIESNLDFLPTLLEFAADVQTVIDTTSLVWTDHPHADAGGPYTDSEGSPITLDGSGSSDPNNSALTYEWDVNLDGFFGDLVGEVVAGTWFTEGNTLVGLKVSNPSGYQDVAYARVVITSANDGPVFTSVEPGSTFVPLPSCDSLVFSASVSDPDGDAIAYEWTLDDSTVGTSSDWEFEPGAVGQGRYLVKVHVTDGSALSPDNQAVWHVDVPSCSPNAISAGHGSGAKRALAIQHTWVGSGRVNISFELPASGDVSLDIFDVTGRRIQTLASKWLAAGDYDITWHGTDRSGNRVASGVYFCRLAIGQDTVTRKIVLVR